MAGGAHRMFFFFLLEHVGNRYGKQAAVLVAGLVAQGLDVVHGQAWPRRVVHQHEYRRIQGGAALADGLQPGQHRVGARRAAGDGENPGVAGDGQFGVIGIALGQRQHHAVDPAGIEERRQAPFQQGAATQRQVLLGFAQPHARAAAGGRHHCPIARDLDHGQSVLTVAGWR